jgi:hypothetical protein
VIQVQEISDTPDELESRRQSLSFRPKHETILSVKFLSFCRSSVANKASGKILLTTSGQFSQYRTAPSRLGVSPERAPPDPLSAGETRERTVRSHNQETFSETSLRDFRRRKMKGINT